MMLEIWFQTIFFLSGIIFTTVDAYVGINIGTDLSNLPSSSNIVSILKSHQITHVRIFNADAHMLNALSNTGIEVMVSVTNEEILNIGQKPSVAASWINRNVAPYIPFTNITSISVGSEVLTSIPHASPILVPAMNNLYKALVASNLNDRVKVSTPFSMSIIAEPFPPSTAAFNKTWNGTTLQALRFLKNTNSFFMLNAYPYYEYVESNGIFPLDYALFKPLSSTKQVVDPNTLFQYSNMLDAMVDAAYNSMASLNFSGIPIVITETGWPWLGGSNEPYATVENAQAYNNNLIKRAMSNNSGPPSHPDIPVSSYIYELFNEDVRPGPVSEQNWGIFFINGSAVYDVDFSGADNNNNNSSNDNTSGGGNVSGLFCVAKAGADEKSLRDGLNWACGPGQANCSGIQQGGPCYDPNTLENHTSYAYNDYYQKMRDKGGTCDFGGTAMITSVDPSYGSCRFTGSSNSSRGGNVPASPSSNSSRNILNNNYLCLNLPVMCVTTLLFLCKSYLILDFF